MSKIFKKLLIGGTAIAAVAAGIAIALFIAWGIMRNFDMSSEILKTGYIF